MWILRRKGGLTAKQLAELCQCRTTRNYIPDSREQFIINYGRRFEGAHLNRNVVFNKLTAYNILQRSGIPQPRIFKKGEEIPDDAFPLLARREYHSQGRDIIYIHNREQLENEVNEEDYDFLVQYIPKTSEYRVHVLGNKAIVNVKFNDDGMGDPIVRNHRNGWRQISYEREWTDALEELAKNVIGILGYDFGAVDIIRRGDKLYVLEVNSAPGLEDRKLAEYANYFKEEEEKWKESSR